MTALGARRSQISAHYDDRTLKHVIAAFIKAIGLTEADVDAAVENC